MRTQISQPVRVRQFGSFRKACVYLPGGSSKRHDESSERGMSLNRSQRGNCSTEYNTPLGTKVVYRRFRVPTLDMCTHGRPLEETRAGRA